MENKCKGATSHKILRNGKTKIYRMAPAVTLKNLRHNRKVTKEVFQDKIT